MQILRWLFNVAHEQDEESTPSPAIKDSVKAGQPKCRDIVPYKRHGHRHRTERSKGHKSGSKNFIPFAFLCRKDVAKACFYSTLNLRRVNSFNTRTTEHWQVTSRKMKKEDIPRGQGISGGGSCDKVDSAAHVGNNVLPIRDNALSSTTSSNDHSGALEKKDHKVKGDKTKTMSSMKELLRWAAAAAKTEKGGKFMGLKVLQFRNRATLKAVPDNDQLSNDSPKISINWEVESCPTTSSAYSSISISSTCKNDRHTIKGLSLSFTPGPDRKGNWITTDSEFVVLEL